MVQRLTEAHGRNWLSPVGHPSGCCAVGTFLSPTSHHGGPTQAGHGPLVMPPALPTSPHHDPPNATKRFGGNSYGKVSWAPVRRKERRKEEKKSQPEKRERMIHFFPHLAPLAPGTVPPSPAAWPQLDLLPLTPLWCPWAVLTRWCITSHWAGSLQGPLEPPCICPHCTSTCSELGQVSAVEGRGPLHTLLEPHFASLAALVGPSPCGRTPDGPKEGAALMHHQRRV